MSPGPHLALERLDDRLGGRVERSDVDGDVLAPLHDRVAPDVAERRGEVARVDHERVAGAEDLLRHLVDRRDERVLEHLEGDRVERVARARSSSRAPPSRACGCSATRRPRPATPGGTSGRRVELVDDGRAVEARARRDLVPRGTPASSSAEPSSKRTCRVRCGAGIAAGRAMPRELGLRGDADRPHAEAVDLDGRAVAPVVVLTLVLGVEAPPRRRRCRAASPTGIDSERHWPR